MKILDFSAGNRAVWFDKSYRDTTYVDIRPEVKPDIVADTRCLPFANSKYDLVVFDPPHVNFGANADMSKTYGHHTTEEIRNIIKLTSCEAHRVTSSNGLMAFKWNDHDQSFKKVLNLMSQWWEPLFGHQVSTRTKHSSSTQWVILKRRSKMPTEGQIIERYIALRDKKRAIEAAAEEAVRPYSVALAQIEEMILTLLVERGLQNIKCSEGTAFKVTHMNVKMEDRNEVIRAAVGSENFDVFTNAVSKDFVKDFIEVNGVKPPGIAVDYITKVNIRKA